MKVKLKFFAGLKNQIGRENMEFELEESLPTIDSLIKKLVSKLGPKAKGALLTSEGQSYKFLVFVNQKIISNPKEAQLKEGDLVYFMPPVSGG